MTTLCRSPLAPCLFVLAALAAALPLAADDSPANSTTPGGPIAVTVSRSPDPLSGDLVRVGPDWDIQLRVNGRVKTVGGGDLVAVRRRSVPLPAFPTGEHLLCVGGERLSGAVKAIDGENVTLVPGFDPSATMSVPLTAVSIVWFAAPDGHERPEQLRRRLLAEQRSKDLILLRNGDVVEGTLTGLDGPVVSVEQGAKAVKEVDAAALAVIALNTDLQRPPPSEGVAALAVLRDGSRLLLSEAASRAKHLVAKTASGARCVIPADDLVALDLVRGPAVALSELKPAAYRFTPYFGLEFPLVIDGSVAGRDLKLGGGTFDRGLGMHAASRVTYDLDGKYRRFEAVVGLDDRTGRDGEVAVRVEVDDRPWPLGWAGLLRRKDGPRAVHVELPGAKKLTLVVDFAGGVDRQSHVDWVDARLIRAETK